MLRDAARPVASPPQHSSPEAGSSGSCVERLSWGQQFEQSEKQPISKRSPVRLLSPPPLLRITVGWGMCAESHHPDVGMSRHQL